MSIGDWFMPQSVKDIRAAYQYKIEQYNSLLEASKSEKDKYHARVSIYSAYAVYNAALAMSTGTVSFKDDEFTNYLTKYTVIPPGTPSPSGMSQEMIDHFTSIPGGTDLLNAIYNFQQLGKDKSTAGVIFSMFDSVTAFDDLLFGLATGGAALIPGLDKILPDCILRILSFPIEIILAGPAVAVSIAINVFLPSVTVAKYVVQISQIDTKINQLQDLLNDISNSLNIINSEIGKQRSLYIDIAQRLDMDIPQPFLEGLSLGMDDKAMLDSMANTFNYFGMIIAIRKAWLNTLAVNPKADFITFQNSQLEALPRYTFTKEEIRFLINFACGQNYY